jgi:hypothetical protein
LYRELSPLVSMKFTPYDGNRTTKCMVKEKQVPGGEFGEPRPSNIPNKGSVALFLIEYTWAVSLQEAIMNAGGIPLTEGLVAPAVVQLLDSERAAFAAR